MSYAQEAERWPYCWALALFFGAIGWVLWPMGQAGIGWAAFLSALCWVGAVVRFNRGWVAWDKDMAYRNARRRTMKPKQDHGNARWGSWQDVQEAGMGKPGGIFLGTLGSSKKELFYNGPGSVLALAPPGAGKSTCLAMQNLLRTSEGSSVVVDVKLELYSTCARSLRKRGFRVICINPWAEEFREQFGGTVDVVDHGLDPCAFLDASRASIIDDCALLASLLIPKAAGQKESEDFWRDFSQTILVAFMLLLLERHGQVTLVGLRRAVMGSTTELEAAIEEMEQSEGFSGALREYGARLAGPYVNAPKEWSGGHSGAMKALRVYDAHGPLGRHVARNEVDFSTMKDRKTVVFVAIPAEKVEGPHAAWLGMVLTLAMEMLARDRRLVPVTILVDEFQNLPRIDQFLKGLALYRGVGLRFIYLVQFWPALRRIWGDAAREFLGCDVICSFGASGDPETLKLFSDLAGQESFQNASTTSDPEQVLGQGFGVSMGSGEQSRPLLRLEDARRLPDQKMLVYMRNLPPILADKQSYLDVPRLRRRADPNPYYRKKK